jgi:hypothetical protein
MFTFTNTEVVGTIQDIHIEKTLIILRDAYLYLRDEQNRLMTIRYQSIDRQGLDKSFSFLKPGMKVKVTVQGKVSSTKAAYDGIGMISLLDQNDPNNRRNSQNQR